MQIQTHSPEETEAVGRKLAAQLRPGDVLAYYGDLGAGKTAFTRGLAAGLGVTEPVTLSLIHILALPPAHRLKKSRRIGFALTAVWTSPHLQRSDWPWNTKRT